MAEKIGETERNVYLKVHLPRDVYETIAREWNSETRALMEIRTVWEATVRRLSERATRRVL